MRPLKPPLHRTGGETIPADVFKAAVRMATLVAYDPVQTKVVRRLKQVGDWLISLRMLDGEITLTYTSLAPKGVVTGAVSLPLYSGVVDGGRIKRPTEEELELAQLEKRPVPPAKLLSYRPSANAVAEHRSYKFHLYAPVEFPPLAIQPGPGPLRDPPLPGGKPPRYVASQYKRMRPTHFTGAMRQVVQYRMGCPDIVTLHNGVVVSETGTPGEEKHAGRIRYSFGWDKTHGLYTAPDETRWVLEISRSGVRAWVLPVLLRTPEGTLELRHPRIGELPPETRGPQTERVYAALGATQQELFEQQGWLPLGDDPVDAAAFAAAEAAGMACNPADAALLAPFYDAGEPYFPACGWAFSQSGKAAANTGFTVDPANTHRKARYMRLAFTGGQKTPDGGYSPVVCTVAEFAEKWAHKLGGVYFPVPSIIPGAAPVLSTLQNRPRSWPAQPPSWPPDVDVDMVVYAYFDGDAEVRIHSTASGKAAMLKETAEVTTTGGMYCGVGMETTTTVRGYTGKAGGVYTTHRDDRKLPEGASTVTTVARKFHGWTGQSFGVDPGIDCWGSCQKVGVVEENTTSTTTTSKSFGQLVYIPAYDREAYFYMTFAKSRGVSRSTTRSGGVKASSSVRKYYQYDRGWIVAVGTYFGYTYILMKPRGYRGALLTPGPVDGIASHIYKHYEGHGWVECDPPYMGDDCAGPLPSGPNTIPPSPIIPYSSTGKTAQVEEAVQLWHYRSRRAPRKLYDQTLEYGAYTPTLADNMMPFNAEGVDGVLSSFATSDAFNPSAQLATPPYLPVGLSEAPGLPQRYAYTTTFIGVPNGLHA